MTNAVLDAFGFIPGVNSIYQHGSDIWIFTDNATYDDVMLDRLMIRECALIDEYPDLFIRYIPLVLCDPADVVNAQAVQIW